MVIPSLVKQSWWQHLLHTHRAHRLRSRLLRFGGSRLVVIDLPWYLEEPDLDAALAEQQAAREAIDPLKGPS